MPGTPRHKNCNLTECGTKIDDIVKAINCSICHGWFHLSCTSLEQEIADAIKTSKNKSLYWKCDNCVLDFPSVSSLFNKIIALEKLVTNKFTKITSQIANLENKQSNEDPKVSSENTSTNNSEVEDHNSELVDKSIQQIDNNFSKTVPTKVCAYYKRGNCRHGSSGKISINGDICKFQHPPKCLKHCRFGNDPVRGCSGPCDLLHPIICRNSEKYKACFSTKCTLTHLTGTKRNKEPEHYLTSNRNYPNTNNQMYSDNVRKGYTYTSSYGNSNPLDRPGMPQPNLQNYVSIPPLTTYNHAPEYFTGNQVTSMLKQIQGSFNTLLQKTSQNKIVQDFPQTNLPNFPEINSRDKNNLVFTNSNQPNLPPHNPYIFPNTLSKNYQVIPPNPQPY